MRLGSRSEKKAQSFSRRTPMSDNVGISPDATMALNFLIDATRGRPTMSDYRKFYASLICAKAGVSDPRIHAAFAKVDRGDHVGPGPWKVFAGSRYIETPSDDQAFLYQDFPIALAADRGINNGEPSLHARCINVVAPALGERILHVGAGSGYYTHILSELVGPEGVVHAYEIDPEVAERARAALADNPLIHVWARSGIAPDLPAADIIYVNAGANFVPPEWLDALKVGGRLIFPLVGAQGQGVMLKVMRATSSTYSASAVCGAAFIPCAGAQDAANAEAVSAALMTGAMGRIRALFRDDRRTENTVVQGPGWRLEAAQ
jgi:protein-L-isoaspartate(D-aspartate) O-methyltransferase